MTTQPISVDVLIIGAGPAGSSLACFLGNHGITGMILSRDSSTALQPRAHYTNSATFECLRDIGLEDEFRGVGISKAYYGDYRFCYSLAGKEVGRMHSFTNRPSVLGEYEQASPSKHGEVSQNVGEPVLMKFATQHGFKSRFDCKFLSYEIDPTSGLITSTILDQLTNIQFQVVSKYLCGADGASSPVARQAGLPFITSPVGGVALNVWYEADLSHLYNSNPGILHAVVNPHIDPPEWAMRGINRVVKPYTEFLMGIQPAPTVTSIDVTESEVLERLRQMIGDETVEIKIKGIYRWRVNESYAATISKGNIFCLGDAIHRHPPGNALGSNTCIQDAYNLAWKLAYVLQGKAGASLLGSYNYERQPVAKRIVRIANDCLRNYAALYKLMGIAEPTIEERIAAMAQLEEASPTGAARRAALRKSLDRAANDVTGLGAEMNQAYESEAVYLADETDPRPEWDDDSGEGVRHHVISTYPGSRLPHAWLGTSKFGEKISTHDLAGYGRFVLFTGIGGAQAWERAAGTAKTAMGDKVDIKVVSIGYGQEYEDMYFTWMDKRGVEEDGAILVRPDRTVAWRAQSLAAVGDCAEKLVQVMRKVLSI